MAHGRALKGMVDEVVPAPCILQPASCNLHPAPCTLHPALCTLQPAPCTLHPTPQPHYPHLRGDAKQELQRLKELQLQARWRKG